MDVNNWCLPKCRCSHDYFSLILGARRRCSDCADSDPHARFRLKNKSTVSLPAVRRKTVFFSEHATSQKRLLVYYLIAGRVAFAAVRSNQRVASQHC